MMKINLESYGNGWHAVYFGIKESEIDALINLLRFLKEHPDQHFPIVNKSSELADGNIESIEFYLEEAKEKDNMILLSEAINPD